MEAFTDRGPSSAELSATFGVLSGEGPFWLREGLMLVPGVGLPV